MAENEDELRSLLRKVKEESENAGLKLNIPKKKKKPEIKFHRGTETALQSRAPRNRV